MRLLLFFVLGPTPAKGAIGHRGRRRSARQACRAARIRQRPPAAGRGGPRQHRPRPPSGHIAHPGTGRPGAGARCSGRSAHRQSPARHSLGQAAPALTGRSGCHPSSRLPAYADAWSRRADPLAQGRKPHPKPGYLATSPRASAASRGRSAEWASHIPCYLRRDLDELRVGREELSGLSSGKR